MYFIYGENEIDYLKSKDPRLGEAIDQIGPVRRAVDPDLFSSVVHHIVGQQISSAAQATIWKRLCDSLGEITAEAICCAEIADLQKIGTSFRKAEYIKDFAQKVNSGEFDIESLRNKPDREVVAELSALKGIGVWTAEMLMLFSMQRPDILSYGDLAILRGIRMLYRHRSIDKKLFERYRRRYSPYGTVASLYLWAIAGGAIENLSDPAPKKKPAQKPKK